MTIALSPTLTIDGVIDVLTEGEAAITVGDSVTGGVVMVEEGVGMGDAVVDVDVSVNVGGKTVGGISEGEAEATMIGVRVASCAIGVDPIVASLVRITIVIPGIGVEVGSTIMADAVVIEGPTSISLSVGLSMVGAPIMVGINI